MEFPRLRGRVSDSGEADMPASIWTPRSLATVREEAPPTGSRVRFNNPRARLVIVIKLSHPDIILRCCSPTVAYVGLFS